MGTCKKEEVEKCIMIAEKMGFSADDLYMEKELREGYGEFQHLSLMDFSNEELEEAAKRMTESAKK